MKKGAHTYFYKKQLNGQGRFGMVEIQVLSSEEKSKVIDDCQWKIMRKDYPNTNGVEVWKNSAIAAAQFLVETFFKSEKLEIRLIDVLGLFVDTAPSHIGVALIIGVFDILDSPLNEIALKNIDNFVIENSDLDKIPDYNQLKILKSELK